MALDDEFAVRELIARFSNSFDLKNWDELRRCFTSLVYTDYSDLRGTPPETMTRERFVELRQAALQALNTHHLAGNVEIQFDGHNADCKVSMVIYRRSQSGEVLNTHCLYKLRLEKADDQWAICSIAQKVFWSDGQKAIHGGITTK